MSKLREDGTISGLAIGFIAACALLIAAILFGASSYSNEQKYKNDDTVLINQAVEKAEKAQQSYDDGQFKIESENPFTSYTGPSQYGSVYIEYPKNWSGYVDTGGSNPLDGYFSPGVVQSVEDASNVFPLRIEVNANSYSDQLEQYTAQQQSEGLSITPFALKKVPSVTGVMIQGQVQPNKNGIMVMLPIRTNTLEIWTESTQYDSFFNTQILPNVSFSP